MAVSLVRTGGRRLFFGSDPTSDRRFPVLHVSPSRAMARLSTLTWSQSEDGGSPITGYNVYRSAGGPEQLIATLGGNARRYVDSSGDATTNLHLSSERDERIGTSCGTMLIVSEAAGSSCDPMDYAFSMTHRAIRLVHRSKATWIFNGSLLVSRFSPTAHASLSSG